MKNPLSLLYACPRSSKISLWVFQRHSKPTAFVKLISPKSFPNKRPYRHKNALASFFRRTALMIGKSSSKWDYENFVMLTSLCSVQYCSIAARSITEEVGLPVIWWGDFDGFIRNRRNQPFHTPRLPFVGNPKLIWSLPTKRERKRIRTKLDI